MSIGKILGEAVHLIEGGTSKVTTSEAKKALSGVGANAAKTPTTRDIIDPSKGHKLSDLQGMSRNDFAIGLKDIGREIGVLGDERVKLKVLPGTEEAVKNLDKHIESLETRKADLNLLHSKSKTWKDFAGENAGTILGGTAMTAMTVLPMAPMLMSAPGAGAPAISPPTTSTLA